MLSPFIEGALSAIGSGSPDNIREGFLKLAEAIAVNRFQNFRSDIVPEANDEILDKASLEELQQAVRLWIEEHPDHPCVCSAFWVLNKFRDKTLQPFLQHWLDRYVRQVLPHLHPLGQILVDLNSLGEQCISEDSYSANEHGKNLDAAIKYLRAAEPGT